MKHIRTYHSEQPLQEMTWNILRHATRSVPVPFQLTLKEGEDPVICEEIVRLIPGKRVVAFGTWKDKPVVAKLFYEKGRAKKHFLRETTGIDALIASGTPTPELLWKGCLQRRRIYVLIFTRLNDAFSLETLWQNTTHPEDQAELMQAVTIELATQHVLGIIQDDLHLNNFLLTHNKIYTLDAGSIHQEPDILSKKASLNHLALFFAQLGVGTEKLQEKLFQTYIKSRGWLIEKSDIIFLKNATRQWIKTRWQRYKKKTLRNSTAFARIKNANALIMYDRSYQTNELNQFFINPENVYKQYGTEILKNGRSSTVAKIILGDQTLVLKRYNLKNMWHRLRRCLRQTRAANTWSLAQRLYLLGIPTPKPVAFIENRFLGFRGTSYFLMEKVKGVDIGEYFLNYSPDDKRFQMIAELVVALIFNLKTLQLTHGDLKKNNILITSTGPVLIDFDGTEEHDSVGKLNRAFKKEIRRFMLNWKDQPEVKKLFATLIEKFQVGE